MGIAAGVGFGLVAALIKATTELLNHGLGAALTSWKPYAMVVAGVGGLYLFQNAVQAGRLVFAQPAISLTDPFSGYRDGCKRRRLAVPLRRSND
jgi:hypothetical protein